MRSTRARRSAAILATAALAACAVAVVAAGGGSTTVPATAGQSPKASPTDRGSEIPGSLGRPVAGKQPNVLVITVDDLAEGDLRFMPRTQRLLVDQGTTLDEGLAPTPICAPSRASLLTGQYAHNHGTRTVEGPRGGFDSFRDRRTLPVWLRAAGYDTMFAGKYLNGYGVSDPHYIPPGWNRWRGSVDFSTYSFTRTRFNIDGRVVQPTGHSTDILGRYTTELLREHRTSSERRRPFFLWVNYVAPHHGGERAADDPPENWPSGHTVHTTTPAPRHENLFAHQPLPRHPAMWERDVTGNPFAGKAVPPEVRTAYREAYQQRLESLQGVDEAVGRTVAALRRSGELRRTLIVLNSDNGYLVGQHNKMGKLVPYDDSVRIPIVLRGPGVPRGRHAGTAVTVADLAVTIAARAGAKPTRVVDGADAWPWLRGADRVRPVPLEGYRVADGRKRLYTGIRYGAYTYVRQPNGFQQLYDRAADPGELVNVARRARYRPVLTQLRAWDRRYRDCAGATCPQQADRTARVGPR